MFSVKQAKIANRIKVRFRNNFMLCYFTADPFEIRGIPILLRGITQSTSGSLQQCSVFTYGTSPAAQTGGGLLKYFKGHPSYKAIRIESIKSV